MVKWIGICLLFLLFSTSNCVTTIRPGEVGLDWRPYSTGLSEKPLKPETYIYAPWNSIFVYSTQWQTYKEKVDVLTRDDLTIHVIADITVRPAENKIYFLEKEIGQDYYTKIISPQFRTAVRNIISNYPMVRISKETKAISLGVKKLLVEKLEGKYIIIDDVIIDDVDYSHPILKAIENKLTKEQEMETMKFEIDIANKDAEITKIKANASAEALLIQSAAQAKAQKMISEKLDSKYIQLKAVENPNNKLIIMPAGSGGVPVILNTEK
ncbi:prohibitin family protein [Leptospira sp. GIMC2001]|uniref:prohibitin family protein n=1 Tax=Leptospira sp. GIMC2001 TaxID=1513297 RepID=UPI002349F702|nr:prohibitin family protein [Leptospira sp. GIMC2001]WCL47743.1 prohibitin family protein [Leptospira sp. GIMC2001]